MKAHAHNQGFTLVETFVAIVVLVLAVTGPLTVAWRGLQSTLVSRDRLIATYLAQEAIEHVRYVRDNSVLTGDPWMSDLGECTGGSGCEMDVWESVGASIEACDSVDGCRSLQRDTSTGRYLLSGGSFSGDEQTSFVRKVQIQNTGEPHEKVIAVTVTWDSGPYSNRNIKVTDRIFDWAGGLIAPQ